MDGPLSIAASRIHPFYWIINKMRLELFWKIMFACNCKKLPSQQNVKSGYVQSYKVVKLCLGTDTGLAQYILHPSTLRQHSLHWQYRQWKENLSLIVTHFCRFTFIPYRIYNIYLFTFGSFSTNSIILLLVVSCAPSIYPALCTAGVYIILFTYQWNYGEGQIVRNIL